MAPRRVLLAAGAALLAALGAGLAAPGCAVGYVVRSGWFQAELLASRRPVEEVRASGTLTDEELHALDVIADVRAYGERLGLAATDNYDTIAVGWKRRIWNLSACERLAFRPKTWWFPVVGRVSYLGFFRERDARRVAERLERRGLDVYLRTAGAYSTLGWFRDPILPDMLHWPDVDLAETVLHELTHATVWVPGSVPFNESLATFVGEEASMRWLALRAGPDSDAVRRERERREDARRWRALLHDVFSELDALYARTDLSDADKLARRAEVFASLPGRVRAAGFHDPEPWLRAAERGPWNNARLVQFRTYHDRDADFRALLDASGGDLRAFLDAVREAVRGADDPFAALADAAARAR